MSYEPTLVDRALEQFHDLMRDKVVYDALMERIVRLVNAPWDARPGYPDGDEPEFREAEFAGHGLLSFRIDDNAEKLIIFNILWAG